MKNTNARLFWLINLSVWVIYYVLQGATSPIFLAISFYSRITLIATFLFWIMLITGTYRFIYQKYHFWEKSLKFTLVQTLIAALVMSALDILFRFTANGNLLHWLLPTLFNSADSLFTNTRYDIVFKIAQQNSDVKSFLDMMSFNGQVTKYMGYLIWTIAFNAYRYSENLIEARIVKFRYESQLKEAELINLRSQLNPHFLFNALNSIHSMTLTGSARASDAVLLLADLMRYTLNYEKKDLVTVAEEMDIVKKYLELEQIRFGKRLTYSIDVQPDTLDVKIPPIIVQALAENAIKHSVSQHTEGGNLKVRSFIENKTLILEVINSGQLPENLPSANVLENKKVGIGIENTKKRLAMIYGKIASFDIKNANEREVLAILRIPIMS